MRCPFFLVIVGLALSLVTPPFFLVIFLNEDVVFPPELPFLYGSPAGIQKFFLSSILLSPLDRGGLIFWSRFSCFGSFPSPRGRKVGYSFPVAGSDFSPFPYFGAFLFLDTLV